MFSFITLINLTNLVVRILPLFDIHEDKTNGSAFRQLRVSWLACKAPTNQTATTGK